MKQTPSLDTNLNRLFVIYTLIVMAVTATVAFLWSYQREKQDTLSDIEQKVDMFVLVSDRFFFKYDEPINQLISAITQKTPAETLLSQLNFVSPDDTYYLLDPQYKIISTAKDFSNMLNLSLKHFEPLRKKPITDVFQSLFTAKSVVANIYTMPDGCMLVIERDVSGFIPIAWEFAERFTTAQSMFFILSGVGEVVYHPKTELMTTRHNLGFEISKQINSLSSDRFNLINFDGKRFLVFVKDFAFPFGWKAYYAVSYLEFVFSIIKQVLWQVVAILLSLLVFALVIKRFLNRHLQKPISELTDSIASIKSVGDITEPLESSKFQVLEFQAIAESFNAMASNIKASYELLAKNEEKFRLLSEFSPVWIYWLDKAGKYVYMSPAVQTITGYTVEEFMNDPQLMHKIIHSSDREIYDKHHEFVLGFAEDKPIEFRIITKDGQTKWIRHMCKKVFDSQGRFKGIRGSNADISRRKAYELELLNQKELLYITLESIGDGVISTDGYGLVVHINKEAERLTEWSKAEAVAQPLEKIFKIVHEETLEPMQNPVDLVLKTAEAMTLSNHTVLISKSGKQIPIADSAAPIIDQEGFIVGVVLVFRDVTEKKLKEAETLKASKLESLSVLAGGIAHDFNNLLTAIIGNISLCKYFIEMDSKLYERLDVVERSAERAKNLVLRLMTFAKGSMPVKKPLSVKKLLNEAISFILSGSNCTYSLECEDNIPDIYADETELTQVLHNILINAAQAMPQGGSITIKAHTYIHTAKQAPISLAQGKYIKISITDTGVGIPPDKLSKVFDPYFTTKPQGSGLGLASAYSIIKRHDGHIDIQSKVSIGTTVTIYLPAVSQKTTLDTSDNELHLNLNAKVLFMDDDFSIFDIAKEFLSKLGATVIHAKDGSEAIKLYSEAMQSAEPFDIVILDLTVPGAMGGKEAIARLYEIDPSVKAIVTSGYSEDIVMSNYQDYGFCGVLKKPFNFKSLVQELQRLLS